jgi:hypothetical protein
VAKAPGFLRRFQAQALGVLALAISVSVVMVLVLLLPHDPPTRRAGATSPGPGTTTTGSMPAGSTTTTTSLPSVTLPSVPVVDDGPSGTSDGTQEPATGAGGTQPAVAPTTVPSSTTTTAAPPTTTTTTTLPPYTPDHVGTQSWPGNLDDPYTSATYQVTTTGGVVSASAKWSGTPTLSLTVSCGSATQSKTAGSELYVSVNGPPGNCTIALAEPAGVEATVSYTLTATYPTQPQ